MSTNHHHHPRHHPRVVMMSITFSLQTLTGDFACPGHRETFECNDITHVEDLDLYGTCDCHEAAVAACTICAAEVNVSNTNAAAILDRLGIEFDYCGTVTADDLLGRTLTGNIGRDDSGAAETVTVGARTGATFIDCAVRPGYFTDRLGALSELASLALSGGFQIVWS